MRTHKRNLTAYHIKKLPEQDQLTSFRRFIRSSANVESYNLTAEVPFKAELFILSKETNKIPWINFLKDGFNELETTDIRNISAVLIVMIDYRGENEIFAFTFGYGRFLLRPNCYEKNYGLKVALNIIYEYVSDKHNPNRIRSIDIKTIAMDTIRTKREAQRRTIFETFGTDIQRDLLRAITGTPISSGYWGDNISGSDSITAYPDIEFRGLDKYCESLHDTYNKTAYKDDFYWIDNLRPVNEPEEMEELEDKLVKVIQKENAEISLSVPDFVEYDDITDFCCSFDKSHKYSDPEDIDLYYALKSKGLINKLDSQYLRDTLSLDAKSKSSGFHFEWPLFNCIYGELDISGKKFILSDGEFWKVDNNFLNLLNSYIDKLNETTHPLPTCPAGYTEEQYNNYAADSTPQFLLMDRKTVKVTGNTSPVEICDLLTDCGCFIHVKRKLSSSTLSHLFAQGRNSADLLLMSHDYRMVSKKQIEKEEQERADRTGDPTYCGKFCDFTADSISQKKHEVAFAIIANWNNRTYSEALPFFSKLTLRNCAQDLKRMNYNVSLARIDIV
jgi:uncharacterized protein (TIGR04141 family)